MSMGPPGIYQTAEPPDIASAQVKHRPLTIEDSSFGSAALSLRHVGRMMTVPTWCFWYFCVSSANASEQRFRAN